MPHSRGGAHDQLWSVPLTYAAAAIVAGLTLPRIELRLFPNFVSPMSADSAVAIYSSIASGMMALTGIVFALAFVMVQFSATAYSPRLVLWLARDPVLSHAMGTFTATFLYAVGALSGVNRNQSGRVPFLSICVVIGALLASIVLFVSLIRRVGLLQINQMLRFTAEKGRQAITSLYRPLDLTFVEQQAVAVPELPITQTVLHHGPPLAIEYIDMDKLRLAAEEADAMVELTCAVGDTVFDLASLLTVRGSLQPIDERTLRRAVRMGDERTFEQDPKYALRLLVDIAIRALSPAINDPTTAVQVLDQIQDLLLRIGRSRLSIGDVRDLEGKLRVKVPFPTWDDYLLLALSEITFCGATSVQVMRRIKALVSDLLIALPEERQASLLAWKTQLEATVERSFVSAETRQEASSEDRQGLGVPQRRTASA